MMERTTTTIALACAVLVMGAAVPVSAGPLSSTASVTNAVPLITDIDLPSSVSPTAGSTTTVQLTITAADNNGWQDLVEVRVTVQDPDGNVHVQPTAATPTGQASGVARTYEYSFAMAHYDVPGTYTVAAEAEDAQGAVSAQSTATFTYEELAALSVVQSSLDFGTADPGVRSGATELTVENQGNVAIDLETSGTPLAHESEPVEIAVDRVRYDLDSDGFDNERGLTESPFVNEGFALQPGPSASSGTWWALDVPSGEDQYIPAGSYSGTLTVSAIKS